MLIGIKVALRCIWVNIFFFNQLKMVNLSLCYRGLYSIFSFTVFYYIRGSMSLFKSWLCVRSYLLPIDITLNRISHYIVIETARITFFDTHFYFRGRFESVLHHSSIRWSNSRLLFFRCTFCHTFLGIQTALSDASKVSAGLTENWRLIIVLDGWSIWAFNWKSFAKHWSILVFVRSASNKSFGITLKLFFWRFIIFLITKRSSSWLTFRTTY